MLKYLSFTGINNQMPADELPINPKTGASALVEASNVDIDLAGHVARREGFTSTSDVCHLNLWQADGFMLATKDGDLVNVDTDTVLYPSLGGARVWYTNLPDGRTTFSNGSINGITDGATVTKWGVPLPAGVGAVAMVAGSLHPGRYKYQITHVRIADGLEGGPTYAAAFDIAEGEGGLVWTGLPAPPTAHKTNVYLTSHNDDTAYLATSTTGTSAAFSAGNETLTLPCKTEQCYPAPAGILLANWRGRTLIATGNLLLASRAQRWELFDLAKDFKQFPADITLVQPVEGGIFVGTSEELAFLSGTEWEQLAYHRMVKGAVVLGSGVAVPGQYLKRGDGIAGAHDSLMCIAAGLLTAGYPDGGVQTLSQSVYATEATEVAATFRLQGEIPQYIAIAQ